MGHTLGVYENARSTPAWQFPRRRISKNTLAITSINFSEKNKKAPKDQKAEVEPPKKEEQKKPDPVRTEEKKTPATVTAAERPQMKKQ